MRKSYLSARISAAKQNIQQDFFFSSAVSGGWSLVSAMGLRSSKDGELGVKSDKLK
jgi:hypothetical protein